MQSGSGVFRACVIAGVFAVAAGMAACSKKPRQGHSGLGSPGQAAPGTPGDFAAVAGDRVFFSTDSSMLSAEAKSTLQGQARWLAQYPNYTVTVEGHADERGTREYNIALGARRAEAVRTYLGSIGVSPSRLRTVSFGKERPVAVCDNISCWSQNRRAVTLLGASAGS